VHVVNMSCLNRIGLAYEESMLGHVPCDQIELLL
jgi:hypothetical protein